MCIFFQVCILTRFNFLTKEPKFLNENFMIQKIKNLEVPSTKNLKIRGILQKNFESMKRGLESGLRET